MLGDIHSAGPACWSFAVTAAVTSVLLATSAANDVNASLGETRPPATTRSARALKVTDTAHLHYVKESGSRLLEEGSASGTLPGAVKVRFSVGASVSSTFTIYARAGSISGNGTGALHSSGAYASFGGAMSVSHGTGRYVHAHGHGGFYGTINRHNYAIVLQTTGTLSY